MHRPELHLHRERVAVHRLADSIWWGAPFAPLDIATLPRRGFGWPWLLFLAVLVAVLFAPRGC